MRLLWSNEVGTIVIPTLQIKKWRQWTWVIVFQVQAAYKINALDQSILAPEMCIIKPLKNATSSQCINSSFSNSKMF